MSGVRGDVLVIMNLGLIALLLLNLWYVATVHAALRRAYRGWDEALKHADASLQLLSEYVKQDRATNPATSEQEPGS